MRRDTLFNRKELIKDSLITFKLQELRSILGYERVRQYYLNGFALEKVLAYFTEEMSQEKQLGSKACLMGFEFNVYLLEVLKALSAQDIQSEVPLYGTRVDAIAYIDGKTPFTIIKDGNREAEITLPRGYHTFEAKCTSKLTDKCVKQALEANKMYDNTNVFVLKDTIVPPTIYSQLRQLGTNIIVSDVQKSDMEDRLNNIKERIVNGIY